MKRCRQGFSLFEISVVLLIIAIITAGGAVVLSYSVEKQQYDLTQARLRIIQQALLDFRRAYNRLPCPADGTYVLTNPYFGKEAANPGTCTGGTPVSNFSSGSVVGGMVPTKTLKLHDDIAIDGWGHRINYYVFNSFTSYDAFTTIAVDNTTTRMTVKNSAGSAKTSLAAYVVISYGPNGHGAYQRNAASTIAARLSFGTTNANELENCDCDDDGETVPAEIDGVFVQGPATESPSTPKTAFDDVVVYATRADLRSLRE